MKKEDYERIREEYGKALKQLENNAPAQGAVAGQAANLAAEQDMSFDEAFEHLLASRKHLDKLINE